MKSSADLSSFASPSPDFAKSGMQRRITAMLGRNSQRKLQFDKDSKEESSSSINNNNNNNNDAGEINNAVDDLV
jgi:hypothetical protein